MDSGRVEGPATAFEMPSGSMMSKPTDTGGEDEGSVMPTKTTTKKTATRQVSRMDDHCHRQWCTFLIRKAT
jgi:hypothetical protein